MTKPSLKKDPVKYWSTKLDREIKAHDKYRKQAQDSADAARDEGKGKSHQFNIHWSTCKIIAGAIYAKRPIPDVRRRYQKPDPEEKELARLVERALEYNPHDGPSRLYLERCKHCLESPPADSWDGVWTMQEK